VEIEQVQSIHCKVSSLRAAVVYGSDFLFHSASLRFVIFEMFWDDA
jgi:hypothetical protein